MLKAPKHVQVRHKLLEIIEGTQSNERIPSERDLAEVCGVSRMTARKAIVQLETEGILFNKGKKGVFVSDKRLKDAMSIHLGFTEEIKRKGGNPSSKILEFSIIKANREIAMRLGIMQGEEVYRVKRLRFSNDNPVIIDDSYFPKSILKRLTRDIAADSVYKFIMVELKLKLAVSEQRVKAINAPSDIAKLLNKPESSPITQFETTGFLDDGRIFEYTLAYKDSDDYDLVFVTKYGY